METLKVGLGQRSYDIALGSGTLLQLGAAMASLEGIGKRAAVVSNPTVFGLYGARVMDSLKAAGFSAFPVIVPEGEEYKNLLWMDYIYSALLSNRLDRGSAVVALGGGVVGDMAGFAAATYMRGIALVQVPTTLLAQVDSSVGGKTGVNHPLGKNMVGAFWQPSLVWMDLDVLQSLPVREFRAGMAEVIKYGVIWDRGMFEELLEGHKAMLALEPAMLARFIRRSCEIKAEVVGKDEREGGLRAILNYGHTVGHAVEAAAGYGVVLHGEAVGMGMYAEALLAERLGIAKETGVAERVGQCMEAYGLERRPPGGLSEEVMMKAMELDKKALSGSIRFVLPVRVGEAVINHPVEAGAIRELLRDWAKA